MTLLRGVKMANNNKKTNEKPVEMATKTPKPEKLVIGIKKIKVLTTLRGSYGAFDYGDIVEVDARDAETFVNNKAAEYVGD